MVVVVDDVSAAERTTVVVEVVIVVVVVVVVGDVNVTVQTKIARPDGFAESFSFADCVHFASNDSASFDEQTSDVTHVHFPT